MYTAALIAALTIGPVAQRFATPDLDQDGQVAVTDLLQLVQLWGPCDHDSCCPGDIDRDCNVAVPDLLILMAWWGDYTPQDYPWWQ